MKLFLRTLLLFFFTSVFYAQQQSPNILLIIADDLGIDSTPGFGIKGDLPVTTTLDSFRETGVNFTSNWVTPQCSPSRATIMSGKFGIKTGVLRPTLVLDTSHTSLFTKIQENSPSDYNMAVIGKWHIGGNTGNFSHPKDSGVPYYEGVFIAQVADSDYYNRTKLNNEGNKEQVNEYIVPFNLWIYFNISYLVVCQKRLQLP